MSQDQGGKNAEIVWTKEKRAERALEAASLIIEFAKKSFHAYRKHFKDETNRIRLDAAVENAKEFQKDGVTLQMFAENADGLAQSLRAWEEEDKASEHFSMSKEKGISDAMRLLYEAEMVNHLHTFDQLEKLPTADPQIDEEIKDWEASMKKWAEADKKRGVIPAAQKKEKPIEPVKSAQTQMNL